jgi:AAA15 family ATPase/GTPase
MIFHKFTRKRFIIISRIIIITGKSSLGKSDLLDEALSLMAMVVKSSLSDLELSSLEFHS